MCDDPRLPQNAALHQRRERVIRHLARAPMPHLIKLCRIHKFLCYRMEEKKKKEGTIALKFDQVSH